MDDSRGTTEDPGDETGSGEPSGVRTRDAVGASTGDDTERERAKVVEDSAGKSWESPSGSDVLPKLRGRAKEEVTSTEEKERETSVTEADVQTAVSPRVVGICGESGF